MSPHTKSSLSTVGAVGIIAGAFFILTSPQPVGLEPPLQEDVGTIGIISTSSGAVLTTPVEPAVATTSSPKINPSSEVKSAPIKQPAPPSVNATKSDSLEVKRIGNPYPFPPLSFAIVNEQTRLALVNILCSARSGSLRPISASAVIIDPRGVILTNAHVAQYVLLASDPKVDLSCVIRVGSPARARFIPEVLYIPPVWVKGHASEIKTSLPLGTGEHDYALLRITGTTDGSPLPPPPTGGFPYLPLDVRETIGFIDDSVLVASYPAEFIGGITSQLNLFPVSSITTIKNLLTFSDEGTVDLVSIGGVIGAQSGSSGGAIVNAWGRLIGIISTTSEGKTTAERDLRAVTLSYINRDIAVQSGLNLLTILGGDIASMANAFNASEAPGLIRLLIDQISPSQR